MIKTLTNADYHAGEGVSKSDLDKIARSPAHFRAAKDGPPESPTPEMVLGSLFHTLTLEPIEFSDEYTFAPSVDKRTKAGKEAWLAFEAEANGKTIITEAQYETAKKMAAAILSHPTAGPLVKGDGDTEFSIFWNPAVTPDLLSKCRPDFIKRSDGRYSVIDLKSTKDARPFAFQRSAWNFRYHVQAAYYWDGCTNEFSMAPESFIFIACEKEPPYAVVVYEASIEMLNAGREEYYHDLQVYQECLRTGVWPGYPVETVLLMPPRWAE